MNLSDDIINNNIPDNACIRTDPRWDNAVRHLGYEPVDMTSENVENLRKDTEIVSESQERLSKVEVIPDEQLSPVQRASLELIREINNRNARVRGVYAALIPPASDKVRTAGMYGRHNQNVYIHLDQLNRGQIAVDTGIHEMSHHTSGDEDGSEGHIKAIPSLAEKVVEQVNRGEYDQYLKNPIFTW
ncbi:MAG: hypothetical protein PHU23_01065 [Dehalococcoidales bacterium]|nr:hypothetical protein [Dehalococcoidales bacterium]